MGFESAHNYILPDPDKTPEEQEELYRNVDHNMRAADLREKLATVQRETAEEEKARDRRVSNELAEEDRRDPTGEARAARAREVAQATAARIRWDAGEEERTRQTRAEERRQEAMAPEVEAARERDRRIAEDARTIRRIEQEERRGDWTEADREHGRMEGERR
ncbi:MAG TPA: hypothetical protein VJ837_01175, partial [Candidatus Paceibacterota bacterium]|nr:hypothetical protein [Candidatus Paceibacterota bacterium]